MALHTEETLQGAGVAQVLDFHLAQAAFEAVQAVGLVAGEDGQVVDFLVALLAVVQAVRAYEVAVAQHEEIQVATQQQLALQAFEAQDMPPIVA